MLPLVQGQADGNPRNLRVPFMGLSEISKLRNLAHSTDGSDASLTCHLMCTSLACYPPFR